MKPVAPTHAHHDDEHPHVQHSRGTTLTQGVERRLLVAAPALLLLWLLVAWALQ